MNILRRYIHQTLKNNKQRTLLSLISLMLATALLFSVSSLILASYRSVSNSIKQSSGNYHVQFVDVSPEFRSYLSHNLKVESMLSVQHLGVSPLLESYNEEKIYLQVWGYSQEALNDLGLVLSEGRFPENSHECVVSEAILNEAKVALQLNEDYFFDLGHRYEEDQRLAEDHALSNKEHFEKENGIRLKVVGIVNEPSLDVKKPFYSIFTLFDETKQAPVDVYLRYHDIRSIQESTQQLATIFEHEYETYTYNERLMALNIFSATLFMDSHLLAFILVGILLFLLVTVLLIRNSFSNTYINREKHLAILKSIGVTERQRQMMVFYEGFIILAIALPLGLLVGFLLLPISVHTINQLLANISVHAIQLELSHEGMIALMSVVFVLLVAILSIQHSAHQIMKKSVSSILHSNDEIKENHPNYLQLDKKRNIYGQLILKHIRQNLKDYDIALLSVAVVLTLGLFLNCSMAYLRASGYLDISEHNYDVQVKIENKTYPTTLMTQLKQMEGASSVFISEVLDVYCMDSLEINESYWNQYSNENGIQLQIVSYDDRILSNYAMSNHLIASNKIDELLNGKEMAGILISQVYNSAEQRYYSVSDSTLFKSLSLDMENLLPPIHIIQSDILLNGLSNYDHPSMIVSTQSMNQLLDHYEGKRTFKVYFQTNDANRLARDLNLLVLSNSVEDYDVINANATLQQGKTITTLLELLIYGYILCIALMMGMATVCIVSTNFEYRKHEFLLYRIVGLRMKHVRRMLMIEYLFYFVIVYIGSIFSSYLLNSMIYHTFFEMAQIKFYIPKNMMLIILGLGVLSGFILVLFASYKIRYSSYRSVLKNEISML